MSDPAPSKSPLVYKVLIMTLPVGVVIGTIIFMFMYFYMEREDERNHVVIVSHGLRMSDLEDMVGKFTDRIGERKVETEQGREGLRRAASMIEGRLGPQNVGYPVTKSEGQAAHGLLWKSLAVEIRGEENPDEVVFAAVSYSGNGEVADGNTVSTMMMLAQAMAREKMARTLRFVFLPMDYPVEQQDRWLVERCLKPGESCVGIVGVHMMQEVPGAGSEAWQATTSDSADQAWWSYLSKGAAGGADRGLGDDGMPSIWLTHPVFSPDTWAGKKDDRLERTMIAARELRTWLLKAASE